MSAITGKPIIFQVITNFGPGGAQRVFYDHCRAFADRYQVEEVVFDRNEMPDLFSSDNTQHSLDVEGGGSLIRKGANLVKRAKGLAALVRRRKAALVISHMDGANWINVLSFSPVPKILVVHGTVMHDHRVTSWQQALRRKIIFPFVYNRADVTVAVSEGIAAELQACGVKNVRSIPNFFDVADIELKAGDKIPDMYEPLFSGHNILIHSGRFSHQKRQDFLIRVFSLVLKSNPGIKLVLLGDGELRADLLQLAAAEGLKIFDVWSKAPFTTGCDIFFLGYVPNPFVYLAHSHLFPFPSGYEGFPMALCEAMACGVPVLTADCPTGPRQILAPQTIKTDYDLNREEITSCGILLPLANHPDAMNVWCTSINNALKNPGQLMAWKTNAQARIRDFDKDTILKQWFSLIDSLLGMQIAAPSKTPEKAA